MDGDRRHDDGRGDTLDGVASPYPPQFRNRQAVVSRGDHLRSLTARYARHGGVRFSVVPGTVDVGACVRAEPCQARRRITFDAIRLGTADHATGAAHVSLRSDLPGGLVLHECAAADRPERSEAPCE